MSNDDQPVTKPDKKPFLPEQPPPPPPPARPILPEEPPPPPPPDRAPDEDADLEADTEVEPQRKSVPGPLRDPDHHDMLITSRDASSGGWIAAGRFGDYAITG